MEIDDLPAPFWDHFDELRKTLFSIGAVVGIAFFFAIYFYQSIFSLLTAPLNRPEMLLKERITIERMTNQRNLPTLFTLPKNSTLIGHSDAAFINESILKIEPGGYAEVQTKKPANQLVALAPAEGISAIIKTSFWVALTCSSPLWILLIFNFIKPALYKHQRRKIVHFWLLSLLFLTFGALFAHQVTIPIANQYLLALNNNLAENFWSIGQYLNYTVILILANAFAFESAIILLFLVHHAIISVEMLTHFRRHAYVAIFIISAILTPPDVLTQILLAIPLIVLYEAAISYAKLLIVNRD